MTSELVANTKWNQNSRLSRFYNICAHICVCIYICNSNSFFFIYTHYKYIILCYVIIYNEYRRREIMSIEEAMNSNWRYGGTEQELRGKEE